MFDLATRLQPSSTSIAALVAVPFDLRLTPPAPASAYPYTAFVTPTAVPSAGVDMLASYALALEGGLATAVILSLFTDRRAGIDDTLPLRQTDRRGWVGDEFVGAGIGSSSGSSLGSSSSDAWGSGLWLLAAGKATANVLELARFSAREALAWLLRDGIASRIDCTAQFVASGPDRRLERLAIRPTIWQPQQVSAVYDVLWGTSLQRWASA